MKITTPSAPYCFPFRHGGSGGSKCLARHLLDFRMNPAFRHSSALLQFLIFASKRPPLLTYRVWYLIFFEEKL